MAETDDFAELIRQVRRGDAAAAEQLWRRYEPLLRREIRLRLRDGRLRQRFDENDVCQSVMASFFLHAAAGDFDLDSPQKLQALLGQMGRNKLTSQVRRHQAGRRDLRRGEAMPAADNVLADGGATPSQIISLRELLDRFRAGLSDEERQLADLRAQGQGWADIAAALGGTPDGRRVQLNRAVVRLSRELGLEEDAAE
jgi:RNA polymerase sigma factor (sigma-70 family)